MSPKNVFDGDKYVTLKSEKDNFGGDKYVTLKQVENVMTAVFKGFGVICQFFRLAVTNMSLFYRYQAPQRKRAGVRTNGFMIIGWSGSYWAHTTYFGKIRGIRWTNRIR